MIETCHLKNVVIFIQTILNFALSRKIINIYIDCYNGFYMLPPLDCHNQILSDHQQSELHLNGLKHALFVFLHICLVLCWFQMAFITTPVIHKVTIMSLSRSFLDLVLLSKIHLLHQVLEALLLLITTVEYLQLLVVDNKAFGGLC